MPCRRADMPVVPECPEGEVGDFDSNEGCDKFIHCTNGVKAGPFSCGALHFNPLTRSCDRAENLDPPCEGGLENLPLQHVPLAPILKPVEQHSFRERLFTKLHLSH